MSVFSQLEFTKVAELCGPKRYQSATKVSDEIMRVPLYAQAQAQHNQRHPPRASDPRLALALWRARS
jgi:hypothetical protein